MLSHNRKMTMSKRFVVAMDSFKGCLTSKEAGEAVADGIRKADAMACVDIVPVSDGGEGMLDCFLAVTGGECRRVCVHDPMMRRIEAEYAVCDGKAIIESARTCGFSLLKKDELNPVRATSYGLGEMLASAIKDGCRDFIIGLGGTCTSDAGIGMLRAMVEKLKPATSFGDLLGGVLCKCHFTLASDVTAPLLGFNGAAHVFAPQKGADRVMVNIIEERGRRFAEMSARYFGYDRSTTPGAGAAGGLGYAFLQYMHATTLSGAELMLNTADFSDKVKGATAVITGEGCSDSQTLMGKLPSVIKQYADEDNVPTWLLSGKVKSDAWAELIASFSVVKAVSDPLKPLEYNMLKDVARQNIALSAMSCLQ